MAEKQTQPCCEKFKTMIGGQALIEGIMMRGPKKISMAVRNPEGEMVIETWDNDGKEKPAYYKAPFLRGIFGFIDSMKFGYKCLMRSAEIAGLEDMDDNSSKTKKKDSVANNHSETVDSQSDYNPEDQTAESKKAEDQKSSQQNEHDQEYRLQAAECGRIAVTLGVMFHSSSSLQGS